MTNNEAARERVIKGLEQCSLGDGRYCDECPYHYSDTMFNSCSVYLMRDALELLKAQEPVEPKVIGDDTHWYECECGTEIDYKDNYCRRCGRMVKWDG